MSVVIKIAKTEGGQFVPFLDPNFPSGIGSDQIVARWLCSGRGNPRLFRVHEPITGFASLADVASWLANHRAIKNKFKVSPVG